MNKELVGIIVCMLLVGTVLPVTGNIIKTDTINPLKAVGNTLYVGGSGEGNYTKIQDAINDAVDGDTVFVFNGTFYEYLIIDKSIQLIGESKNYTIIQSNMYSRHVIDCESPNGITIKEFTLCNGYHGVNIKGISNIIIDDNIIKDCKGPAIYIHGGKNNIISNNLVMNCSAGVHIWGSSSYNTISYNILNSRVWGMYIAGGTKSNTFHNNQIYDNENLTIEFRNTVEDNTFFENTIYGKVSTQFSEVNNNLFYHNNFFCRFKGLGDINNWDNGKEGNYWVDNRGVDKDGDGICDTPYPSKEFDRYPLTRAIGIESTPPEKPILTGPAKGKIREVIEFTVVTTDYDNDTIRYLFDWGDGTKEEWSMFYNSNETVLEKHYWWKETTFNVRVKAKDYYGFESEWSDTLSITIPRTRAWLRFIDMFPILQKILNFIH